jgi:hypothetical protein
MQALLHPDTKSGSGLARHMLSTYVNLRVGLAFIALSWPFILWIGGNAHGIPLQDSLSDYYHAEAASSSSGTEAIFLSLLVVILLTIYAVFVWQIDTHPTPFTVAVGAAAIVIAAATYQFSYHYTRVYPDPLRSAFVGVVILLAVFLYLYKGFSNAENYLLTGAGLCAAVVAFFPNGHNCSVLSCSHPNPHGVAGYGLFICITLVTIFCSTQTLEPPHIENKAAYKRTYRVFGGAMIAFALILLPTRLFVNQAGITFFMESVEVWLFGGYWLLKSRELKESQAEMQALRGTFRPTSQFLSDEPGTSVGPAKEPST